jgi:hypothetical protein
MRPRTPPLIEQWTRPTTPDDHRLDVHSCSASGHRYNRARESVRDKAGLLNWGT